MALFARHPRLALSDERKIVRGRFSYRNDEFYKSLYCILQTAFFGVPAPGEMLSCSLRSNLHYFCYGIFSTSPFLSFDSAKIADGMTIAV
jgi:hypothetical protein